MKRILLIGIGSRIMRDDGIGTRVAEALQSRLGKHDIIALVGETDFQYCFDEIKEDDLLIIIDAMVQGDPHGSIDIMRLNDAIKNKRKLRTQHEFSLLDLIELNYPNMQGYFIGVEVSEIGFGFDLSELLSAEFQRICDYIFDFTLKLKEENDARYTFN